jgi:hypothetical protein
VYLAGEPKETIWQTYGVGSASPESLIAWLLALHILIK